MWVEDDKTMEEKNTNCRRDMMNLPNMYCQPGNETESKNILEVAFYTRVDDWLRAAKL